MNNNEFGIRFSTRNFINQIRAELAAAGRSDVPVERSWIGEDDTGLSFVLRVPVGTDAVVPLRSRNEADDIDIAAKRGRHAAYFAEALINLDAAEKMLVEYAGDIRRSASAAIEAARANGLDIQLERVGFRPVSASRLTGTDWKTAADHVLAAVTLRVLGSHLRPTETTFWVEEGADVAAGMKGILEEQRALQDRAAELESMGADFVVDQITLDILAAHGLEAGEVLLGMRNVPSSAVTVQHEGQDLTLSLMNHQGAVSIFMAMRDAVWNGSYLWLLGDEEKKDHKHLVGKSLGDLVRHPAFASRPVAEVDRHHVDHVHFDLSDKVLFDADSGRLWRDEKLAA